RVAPIQVSFLGYPCTLGVDYMDYLLADNIIIPHSHRKFYTEQIVCLPHSYQPNDRQRLISEHQFTRSECGLPEQGFVFCCFNNNYKITPALFACWMRLLQHVEGSVLWLLKDNTAAAERLKLAATAHGVAPERLIFAERLPLSEHLARHGLADLFLDTTPCNAHTTASDALWAGLPVLTCIADTFASRVAASLLSAVGLSELITTTLEDYERLALQLARDTEQLTAIKQTLARNRLTHPLFDTPLFAKHLEQAYQKMYLRYQQDLLPEHFDVQALMSDETANALINRGNELEDENCLEEALACYNQAILKDKQSARAYSNRGNVLQLLQRFDEAIDSYNQAIVIKPDYAEAFFNRGNALQALARLNEALDSYQHALQLKPDFVSAWSARGMVLQTLKRLPEALECFEKVLSFQPDNALIWVYQGAALQTMQDLPNAIVCFEKALNLEPDYDFLFGATLHLKMRVCDWQQYAEQIAQLSAKIKQGKKIITPFALHAISANAELQKQAAVLYAQAKYPSASAALPSYQHEKIKLGYFSSDFRHQHPVADLTAQLFECHDRTRFEVFAFSFHAATVKDETRLKLETVFDQFFDVSLYSDEQVVRLARDLELDIAIDLNGFTEGNRAGIFALRVAPIQVSYLGFLGTMGADYMDYLLADSVLIPETEKPHYVENIVYLPHSFQVNNNQQIISNRVFNRTECGLPEHGFVFCCFNNSFKITPDIFSCWMRVLNQVENSVLWLVAENETAKQNLRASANVLGIKSERLQFAERVPLAEHLARQKLADLFLDTSPYNAGATASAALWAGLPVLTFLGMSFSSRMGASLLTAVGLPELIAKDLQGYERLAIELATQPEKLSTLKTKLATNRLTYPLFDTPLFTKHLEAAYQTMIQRHQNGLAPATIQIIDNNVSNEQIEALINRGNELEDEQCFEKALACYEQALQLNPQSARAYSNRGNVLQSLKRYEEALSCYHHALAIKPDYVAALFNCANALQKLNRLEEALTNYELALKLNADFTMAYMGRAVVLQSLQRYEDAVADYQTVLEQQPDYAEALISLAAMLQLLGRFKEAETCYQRAYTLTQDESLWAAWLHSKMKLADWQDFDKNLHHLEQLIEQGTVVEPFPVMTLSNRADLHKLAAEHYALAKYPDISFEPLPKHQHEKIKVGYFSADFRVHPVSFLTAELFECHDKTRFEIIAFSFNAHKDSTRSRLEQAFDSFIDVSQLSDAQVVALAREQELDIAIDLNGYTEGARTNIFAMRVAPVQAIYLGYLGTMGASYMDYLIADSTLISIEHRKHYCEKIVYLPSFQVNDSTIEISKCTISRAESGLPEQGFVFCCFNSVYKITPMMFACWMRILKAVDGSVLWLLENNQDTQANLKTAAIAHGVNAERLIFAKRVSLSEHSARHALADLFLDTQPCNAGATASTALWAGLPILTYLGETFAGRMGASLLNAIGLSELIAENLEHYEKLAIDLGLHSESVAAIKAKLAENRLTQPLFNTVLFTQHLEAAYQAMVQRVQQDLPPDDIEVSVKPMLDLDGLIELGNHLEDEQRFNEALACYDQAIFLNPNYARAYSNRGNVLQLLQRFDEAIDSYNQALSIKSDYSEALYNRGNTLQALACFEDALDSYQQALNHRPDFILALLGSGAVLQALKRDDQAMQIYQQVLTLDKNNALARSALDEACLFGAGLYKKMTVCDWQGFDDNLQTLIQ
ncbi:hypothetical protein DOJK_00905, partial [Patescibacteria group bacterium]